MTGKELYEGIRQRPRLQVDGKNTGEGFCWHAAFSANAADAVLWTTPMPSG